MKTEKYCTLIDSSGILAYFDFDGLSTGPLEGINKKIKTLHKMAYGFRDVEFLWLLSHTEKERYGIVIISIVLGACQT